MKALLNQEFEIQCPGGGRSTKMKLDKILNSSTIRTGKGEYKLNSSDKSRIKSHLRDMEREQERFEKLMEKYQKLSVNELSFKTGYSEEYIRKLLKK